MLALFHDNYFNSKQVFDSLDSNNCMGLKKEETCFIFAV